MTSVAAPIKGSAVSQGDLWNSRSSDWAEIQEGMSRALYDSVLRRAGIFEGIRLLDTGCGSGSFAQLAWEKGAAVTGLDAASTLVAIARARTPGDFRVGELESLPFADRSFDLVTGFNSFQFAANPVNALREARRVVRAGGHVFIATWGKPLGCEAAGYLAAVASLAPTPPPGAPGPFALSGQGALERLVGEAGLLPIETVEVDCIWGYPDLETALKGLLSIGPATKAIRHSGETAVRNAVIEAIRQFRTARGGYQLENKFCYLVAQS